MAQVIITVSKLDNLAEAVNNLTDATLPLTLDQMTTEINNFTTQHYCVPHADIPEYIKKAYVRGFVFSMFCQQKFYCLFSSSFNTSSTSLKRSSSGFKVTIVKSMVSIA